MSKNCMSLITLGLCFFVIVSEVRSGVIIDGLKKAIDNTKCHLHGISNAIHHHEHDSNPCKVKNPAGNNQQGISGNTNSQTTRSPISQGNKNASTSNADSRRLINPGANCPEGFRADANGNCYMIY